MLSGIEIIRQVANGNIEITPFNPGQARPHSYDLRLGETIMRSVPNCSYDGENIIDTHRLGKAVPLKRDKNGVYILRTGNLYLAHTVEVVHTNFYGHELMGRSTCGRFGIAPHPSTGFGDAGWKGQYVLELYNVNDCPVMIYPGDRICQIKFSRVEGDIDLYNSDYQGQMGVRLAKSLGDV
jgi:deoxycytidine triphosphate deaminase